MCRFHNAILVRVELADWDEKYIFTPGVDDNTSETALDDFQEWDYVIRANHGQIVNMQEQVELIIRRFCS